MTGDEVGKLLGLMALADNRKPPEDDEGRAAMIAFWMSMVGDLNYADAAEAVQAHYRESRDWIMPADVRKRVRQIRTERLARAPLPAPPADLADEPGRYKQALDAGIKRLADGMDPRRAIGARPRDAEPPEAWTKARAELAAANPETAETGLSPQARARARAAESRAQRQAGEAPGTTGEPTS